MAHLWLLKTTQQQQHHHVPNHAINAEGKKANGLLPLPSTTTAPPSSASPRSRVSNKLSTSNLVVAPVASGNNSSQLCFLFHTPSDNRMSHGSSYWGRTGTTAPTGPGVVLFSHLLFYCVSLLLPILTTVTCHTPHVMCDRSCQQPEPNDRYKLFRSLVPPWLCCSVD